MLHYRFCCCNAVCARHPTHMTMWASHPWHDGVIGHTNRSCVPPVVPLLQHGHSIQYLTHQPLWTSPDDAYAPSCLLPHLLLVCPMTHRASSRSSCSTRAADSA